LRENQPATHMFFTYLLCIDFWHIADGDTNPFCKPSCIQTIKVILWTKMVEVLAFFSWSHHTYITWHN
jgi:hypothetical protein